MDAFSWDPSFETHLAKVDEQHRRLVELINRLGDLLAEKGAVPAPVLEQTRRELVDYAEHHFADEERSMEQAGVDARHQERHRRQHRLFREYVSLAGVVRVDGRPGREDDLLRYLVHWLTFHILGLDQEMARQIHAFHGGAPAQAPAVQADDPAPRLLLRSVNELLELLSGRTSELLELNRTLEERVAERTQALQAANAELKGLLGRVEHMAMTDSLTGLPNRRWAMARLASAWSAATRHGHGLGCLLVDADGFKQVNDSWGHEAGDEVLVQLARTLRGNAREADEVCRLGGDEFLVICPETSLEGTIQLGRRLHAAVAALRVEVAGGAWAGSISVGAAALREGLAGTEELLRAADAGVYQAKRAGRSRVATAEGPA